VRNPARIDGILAALKAAWEKCPDLRLGQLVVNAAAPNQPCQEVFHIEDQALVDKVVAMVANGITPMPATKDPAAEWRRLALQFDGHRMQAIWHLNALLKDPGHAAQAQAFLSAPPLSGEQVLEDRIAELAQENKDKKTSSHKI
jgi:uncharacterized protein YihD (DUF1040 family)